MSRAILFLLFSGLSFYDGVVVGFEGWVVVFVDGGGGGGGVGWVEVGSGTR
jgi:hypothetical protein